MPLVPIATKWVQSSSAASIASRWNVSAWPTIYVLDDKGVIRARVDGARDWSQPIAIEFAQSLAHPQACKLEFEGGKPRGSQAGICSDLGLLSQ